MSLKTLQREGGSIQRDRIDHLQDLASELWIMRPLWIPPPHAPFIFADTSTAHLLFLSVYVGRYVAFT